MVFWLEASSLMTSSTCRPSSPPFGVDHGLPDLVALLRRLALLRELAGQRDRGTDLDRLRRGWVVAVVVSRPVAVVVATTGGHAHGQDSDDDRDGEPTTPPGVLRHTFLLRSTAIDCGSRSLVTVTTSVNHLGAIRHRVTAPPGPAAVALDERSAVPRLCGRVDVRGHQDQLLVRRRPQAVRFSYAAW